jgi:hypothetical protein
MKETILKGRLPNSKRRACFDCIHCKAAINWWCTNDEAVKFRGTAIPGTINCKFWEPVRLYSQLKWWEKLFGYFIIIE